MRIACIGYRDWSLNIYKKLQTNTHHKFLMQLSKQDFSEAQIKAFDPDCILFYGWSDIVSSELISKYRCLMLHPSPLPKYRGGSPIQNQIIRGEVESAVTIFLMDDGIDTGPIAKQAYLNLEGSINDIFKRIEMVGYKLTAELLSGDMSFIEQRHEDATYYKRRKPEESEITIEELASKPIK